MPKPCKLLQAAELWCLLTLLTHSPSSVPPPPYTQYWKCPAGPSPAVSRPYGTFGQPGNLTIPLYKKESFTVVCPVQGHCMGGMMFDVYVECPAPQGEHDGGPA